MEYYVGIDVSKDKLDVCVLEEYFQVTNNKKGFSSLFKKVRLLARQGHRLMALVCEPSGGYEQGLFSEMEKHDIPTVLAHAGRVRSYAKSRGILAKTDKLDAKVIRDYAMSNKLLPRDIKCSDSEKQVRELVKRRGQLLSGLVREKVREKQCADKRIARSIKKAIKFFEKEIAEIEEALGEHVKTDREMKERVKLIISVPGVGKHTAYSFVGYLPEAGRIEHKKLSALVGVAPFNRESGQYRGKQFIQGGRKQIRDTLYMAAVSAVRCNRDMKVFYERLIGKGKAPKVALTAVMRKLLCILNSVLERGTPWVETMHPVT